MQNSDADAQQHLQVVFSSIETCYRERGIFQGNFGFGERPAILVVDFAYGWTDDAYAGASKRLDAPVEMTSRLLAEGRKRNIPIVYTTSPFRPHAIDQPFKTAADTSPGFRPWDRRAVEIDERVQPAPEDLVIEKESASAFFGTHLAGYLIQQRVDTVLITGCSTSACIRATATDAKSYRFRPTIVADCVGDRSAAAHAFTLFDIQSRFADVRPLVEVLEYLGGLSSSAACRANKKSPLE